MLWFWRSQGGDGPRSAADTCIPVRVRVYGGTVASYLLHFTKGLVPDPAQMPQLARDLVQHGLYGIPSRAMLRDKLCPGDRVFVTVGSPHRLFVADAVVASG